MGDTLDETPPTRRDKPHTLNIGQEEEGSNAAPRATATVSSIAIPAARTPRNRMRHADRDAKRDHSSDGLVSSGNRRDEFTGLEAQPRRESLNSCEASSPVALSTSLGKAGRLSSAGSSRYPSGGGSTSGSGIGVSVLGGVLGGTTTRKCVLTLDGYSYVIVASTPESLPSKRDEASVGAGATGGSSGAASGNSSSGAASGAASGLAGSGCGSGTGAGGAGGISTPGQEAASPTVAELSGSSGPNATINGQVARHGSLTIIRRTNSRNFNQNDGQQLASPSAATASGTVNPGISFAQTPLSEPLAERLSFRAGSNGPASAGDSRSSNQGSSTGASATTAAAAKMQPSSPNSTNYAADNLQNSSANLSQSESADHTATHSLNALTTGSFLRGDTDIPTTSQQSYETTSNLSFNAGQWETESLPPVDTPDALNKASLRIRSLLRRMDHETVAYEDMQRNLHYAARVLEAVFIDESRSPTSGKTRLGQIASSSVESEEEGCNGDCKNLSCSRHSHGRDPDQQQDNNNSNSSCSLKKVEEEQKGEVAPVGAEATTGDNQASIEGRTKGVSQAPQTHSGPTGPPATTSPSSDPSASTAPAAPKLQPALETVRESVLEENSSKGASPAPTSASASATPSAAAATTDPSAKAAESVTSGGSSSSGNPATVHRQRRLRTPTWARSMSTNKTYLKFDF